MSYRKFLKFLVFLLSILTANLVTTIIDDYMMSYKGEFSPVVFTWLGMAVVVAIYYPLFSKIDVWATKFSDSFVKAGKKMTGKKTGAIVAFFVGLLVLYYFYGTLWFDTNLFSQLF